MADVRSTRELKTRFAGPLTLILLLAFGILNGVSCTTSAPRSEPVRDKPSREQAAVKTVVGQYIDAVKQENVELMWEMLSSNLQKSFEEQGLNREQFMIQAKQDIDAVNRVQGKIEEVEFTNVDVKKSDAKVHFTLDRELIDVDKIYSLEKSDNMWKISDLKK